MLYYILFPICCISWIITSVILYIGTIKLAIKDCGKETKKAETPDWHK